MSDPKSDPKHYVVIPDDVHTRLKDQAKAEGISVSALTRRVLAASSGSPVPNADALTRIEEKLDKLLAA